MIDSLEMLKNTFNSPCLNTFFFLDSFFFSLSVDFTFCFCSIHLFEFSSPILHH